MSTPNYRNHPLVLFGETSKRLYFRKIRASDFEAWLPFYHDSLSTKFWEGLPQDPKTACKQQFDSIFQRYTLNLGGMNALICKKTKEFVGICGLLVQTVDGIEELEIGYSLLPQFRRQGFATEAATKCKQYAREKGLAKSLISIIQIDNIPSQSVAKKNGMFLDKTTVYKNNPVHIFRVIL